MAMTTFAFAQTTYTSTGDGTWSAMTWSPAGTPGSSDAVIIADGHTVTIDQTVSAASLTVGQGTSGVLTFDGVSARAVTVTGDIIIAAGALFVVQASGTFTNTLSIGGNLVNNGTFDMSLGTTTTICNVTFTKAGDQTINGSGTTTRFRGITLSKTAVGNKVISTINVTADGSVFPSSTGTWEQNAGTFTTGTTITTVTTCGISITGSGNWTQNSSNLNIAGPLNINTSGTFTLGGGTSNKLDLSTAGGNATFQSGTINVNGKIAIASASSTVAMTGANINVDCSNLGASDYGFRVTNAGTGFSFSAGTLTILNPNPAGSAQTEFNAAAGFNMTGTAKIVLGQGGATPAGGSGGFRIGGPGLASITNLTINTGTTNTAIQANTTIAGTLTLTSGNITTSTYKILIGSAGSVSRTSGHIIGNLAKTIATGATSRTFEIGTVAGYSPVTVAFGTVSAIDTLIASVTETIHPNAVAPANILKRYWSFTAGASLAFDNYSATLTYLPVDFNTGVVEATDEATLTVGQYSSGWTFPTIGLRTPGGSADGGSIQVTGLISFSDFAIGKDAGSLPVEMTSFTTSMQNANSAILRWSTATEVNNNGFEVERRAVTSDESRQEAGGQVRVTSWEKIGYVAGAGTSTSPKEYSFTDVNLAPGVYVYRLKQIDNSGAFKYSASTQVDIGVSRGFELLNNYPNPFNPETNIRFAVPENGFATLKVFNVLGQEVATLFSGMAQAGHYISATFNASKLASGVYFSRLEYNGKSIVQRMLMTK